MAGMKKIFAGAFALVFASAFAGACGGVSTGAGTCVTGQSIACAGSDGCSGNQVCKADGTYDVCNCGGATSGGDGGSSFNDGGVSGNDSGLFADGGGNDASASDAGGDAGSFTPPDLAGLALWFDENGIVTDPAHADNVVHWLDQSGNGNDATGICNEECPTIDPSGAHGHDAISCADAELTVGDAASLHFGIGDWALAFVYKNSGFNDVTTPIFQKTDGSSPLLAFASTGPGSYTVTEGGSTASASVTFAPTFGYYIMRGPAMSLATSAGSSTGTTATGDVSNTGAPITLCVAGNLSGTIEMAEVIAVEGTVTDAEVAKLAAYFTKKFGL